MCSRRALPAAHNAVAAMLSFIVIRLSGKEPGLVERRVSSPALFPLANKCGPPVHRPQTLLTDKAKKALKTTGRCGAEKRKAPPFASGAPAKPKCREWTGSINFLAGIIKAGHPTTP